MKIYELHYSSTNTYLIKGDRGCLLFDTGWAGTFQAFCRAVGEIGIPVQKIRYILISHYHPDHMGIAEEIAELGPVILVPEAQQEYLHAADSVYEKERGSRFVPVRDEKVRIIRLSESRGLLRELGIDGEILYTPGHSADSISLCLDDGSFFVGDLNPLYELEMHRGTEIEESWNRILSKHPKTVCYGHARTAKIEDSGLLRKSGTGEGKINGTENRDLYLLTEKIMKMLDKGADFSKICRKTGADRVFVEDVARMYLTHQNVGVQGILDRIEIKGK